MKKFLISIFILVCFFCFNACMADDAQSESVGENPAQSEEIEESVPEVESNSGEPVEESESASAESEDSTKESQSEKETVSDWVDIEFPQP